MKFSSLFLFYFQQIIDNISPENNSEKCHTNLNRTFEHV